jgi:predicted MFS family arabinose efflux permease
MTTIAARATAFVVFATTVSFVISLAGSSLKSTVQVLFLPIADGFEVNRGTLAIATTVFAVVTGLASAVVGHLADRIGAMPVLAIGTAVCGGVLILCASATEIWMFIAGYGVLGAIGFTMLSFVPLGVLADQLFEGRNAGLLYAVLTNGAAVGFMVLVPLWAYLDISLSWNQILVGIGLVFLIVLLPLSFVMLKYSGRGARVTRTHTTLREGIRATVRNRQVVVLIMAFFACGTTMAFIDVHLFPHLHDHGVSPAIGSVSVVVLGALEIAGGLLSGRLCDLGRVRATLIWAYLLRAVSMVLLFFFSSNAMVILFGAAFGASYLATVVATTVWITRIMPPGTRGTAIGLLWTIHMIAVAISSQVGATLADIEHNYVIIILASVLLATAAALATVILPDPDARAAEQPAPVTTG